MSIVERTTVYLPRELRAALRAEARRRGQPQSVLIREALEKLLAGAEPALPRSIGIARKKGITGREAKAWLRADWDRRWSR